MKNLSEAHQELLNEVAVLRQRNEALEHAEADRKRAVEALRESEERFRTLSDKTPLGMSLIDNDGRYQYVNPAFVKIFGYAMTDAPTGREWFRMAFPDPEYRRKVVADWKEDLGSYQKLEIRLRTYEVQCKGGAFRTILFRPVTLPTGQQLVVYEDITDRERAEEERKDLAERLQRAEKMEALGTMAGGVAHDLNNVLGVLSGYSEILVEQLPEDNPLREYAARILKSSVKGAAIIQDLLTLARRGVVVSEVCDFNRIVADHLATPEFDRLKAFHPHVTITTDLEKDLLNIMGSPVHLEKTVMNLVSNAVEAIVGSGEVNIRTENRYLDQDVHGYDTVAEGEYVVLTVSDTGAGISPEDMNKMFEPFYTKKKMGRSGTGLGLAIVWGTVKDHNGYIDVQSIEGKGTVFTLYFPMTNEKMGAEAQQIPVELYQGQGEAVLVVDDVQEQRQVATTLLTQLGYQVNAVSSGEAAVGYLLNNRADILVLDMIMNPGIDGLEAYQRIININPHQKAIIVSGFSETERVREARKLGVGAYVKKPYRKEKIGMAVRQELDRNQAEA